MPRHSLSSLSRAVVFPQRPRMSWCAAAWRAYPLTRSSRVLVRVCGVVHCAHSAAYWRG
jgi:hypothetical protein